MARKRVGTGGKVELDWLESDVRRWTHDLNGDLAENLMRRLAEVVLAGAKRRALRRTGRMANAMTYDLVPGPNGVTARVISPALDPRSHNFPYPIVHEGRKVRDRRPHRSLRPALRDIRKVHYIDDVRGDSE